MATYKVLQDIEAEDKLLGPLTLRQFIYAAIVAVCGFIAFKLAFVNPFLIAPFVPIIVFFGLLAAPLGRDQPNEIWLLARIKFFMKPKTRKWDQSGLHDLVTITIPKKIEPRLTKNYTPGEVRSHLRALANTIDTRGWAIKNVNVNLFSQPSYLLSQDSSERLINPSSMPQEVPVIDVTPQDDIFEYNNPKSQHINQILSATEDAQKKYYQQLATNGANSEDQVTPDYWFMNESAGVEPPLDQGYATFHDATVVLPGADDNSLGITQSADEDSIDQDLVNKIEHGRHASTNLANGHMRVIEPLGSKKSSPKTRHQTSVTSHPDNAKLNLLASDNNRSVASLAHEANEDAHKKEPPDEVVISLH